MGEFEQWLRESEVDAYTNSYDAARITWNYKQSKIEQLENLLSLERHRAKALEVELTNSRNYSDKLHEKVEGLEKRIAKTLKMLEGDLSYVEEDRRRNFDFMQMAMIRCLKDDIKTLRGES